MYQIEREVKACGENYECLKELNTKIQEDLEMLPKCMSDSVNNNIFAIQDLQPKINICCEKAYNDFQSRGTRIYDEIIACIKSKLPVGHRL